MSKSGARQNEENCRTQKPLNKPQYLAFGHHLWGIGVLVIGSVTGRRRFSGSHLKQRNQNKKHNENESCFDNINLDQHGGGDEHRIRKTTQATLTKSCGTQ